MNPHQHMRAAHGHDAIEKGFLTYEFYHRLFSGPFLILVVFVILFFSMMKVHSPERLGGELYDNNTKLKIGGAKVMIYTKKGAPLDSAKADVYGRFSFMVQQDNTYKLVITKPGYQTREVDVTPQMNSAESVILKIGMR